MKYYSEYMNTQTVSPALHDRLLRLPEERGDRKNGGEKLMKFGALAACAALLFGIGSGWLGGTAPAPRPDLVAPPAVQTAHPSAPPTPAPYAGDAAPAEPIENGFLIHSPAAGDRLNFYAMPALNFQEEVAEVAASIALPDGSFHVELTLEDLQKVLWGSDGKPDTLNPETDLPWVLGWDGYTVQIGATYDGQGDLWMLTVYGEKGLDSFELEISPGRLPPQCIADPYGESVDVNGTEVTSYYHAYDRNGDGLTDHVCTSEFLAGGYGYRFENVGAPQMTGETYDREASIYFNTLFVRQALSDGGLYMDDLAHREDIPAWASEGLDSLAQALEYKEFAPYLPQEELPGYAQFVGNKDFGGRYNYQEGRHNWLFVRWSRNYDDVEVEVHLPEGKSTDYYHSQLVDVNVPESYDWRLYDGPICDSVPEEYQMSFSKPAFRAEDMSLEVVKARMHPHDTGGEICSFYVLHENGVVVGYNCAGVSAEYVWSLVESTLK